MFMNKKKWGLILAAAIVNMIVVSINLTLSILEYCKVEAVKEFLSVSMIVGFSTNIIFACISFVVAIVGSILLMYSIRSKGKYFRSSYGIYLAGFIIIVICGGFAAWVLLFISMFVPDVIVMNTKSEIKREEVVQEKAYEEKKKKIDDLKRMRDNGLISEEEYKQKLFDLL